MTTTVSSKHLPFVEPPPLHFKIKSTQVQAAVLDLKKEHLAIEVQRLWRGYKSRRGEIYPCFLCKHPICLTKEKANGYRASHCAWCYDYIHEVENEYMLWRQTGQTTPPSVDLHYCGDFYCKGTCGELSCGCIDICRGRCGNRRQFDRYW